MARTVPGQTRPALTQCIKRAGSGTVLSLLTEEGEGTEGKGIGRGKEREGKGREKGKESVKEIRGITEGK